MLTYGTGFFLYRQVMTTTQSKKKQQWQVVYHQDCVGGIKEGGIPCDIVHIHPESFSQLHEAQEFERNNPEPPADPDCNGECARDGRSIMLSAVQVRGPVRCSLQPRLEKV